MSKNTGVGVGSYAACGDLTTFFGASAYRTLRNPKYRGRLPFYTRFLDENAQSEFDFPSDPGQYAEEEARLAAQSGADYFMFCYYPSKPFYKVDYGKNVGLATIAPYLYELNAGMNAFKKLSDKHGMKWCAIIGASRLDECDYEELAADFGSADYEKIGDRPLVYVFTRDGEDYLGKIRKAAAKRGFEPFVVAMYNAERDEGFDGVGSYAACGEPRENYAARYHEQWTSHHDKRLATGLPVVPCVGIRSPESTRP